MSASHVSPAAVLLFLWGRTAANAIRKGLSRAKEPRYLIGAVVGLAYFGSMLLGNFSRLARRPRTEGPGEAIGLLEPALAFGLAVLVLLWWLLTRGKAALTLSESEVQFLFPAPLPRRAVLHYAALKVELGILASALVLGLVMSRTALPSAARAIPGIFLLLATLNLHQMGIAQRRAAWREASAARSPFDVLSRVAAAAGIAGLAGLLLQVVPALTQAVASSAITSPALFRKAIDAAIAASPLGFLLAPARALVAPLFAPDGSTFLRALPFAALLFLANHLWVVSSTARFEDATVEGAARRAARKARTKTGRLSALPGEREREKAPFALAPAGRPELALFWKNLTSVSRRPLRTWVRLGLGIGVVLFLGARFAGPAVSDLVSVFHVVSVGLGLISLMVATLILPTALRADFRRDLMHAAEMKLWPLRPGRLALAELATPLLVCTGLAWTGLFASVAMSGGLAAAGFASGEGRGLEALPFGAQAAFAVAAAILAPAVASVLLVVQNGLTLGFPAWFPPGEAPPRGFAASGGNMIAFFGTFAILGVVAIPSAALAALVVLLGRDALGFWVAPPAALAAALPLYAASFAGALLLGRLFLRYDPATETDG